MADRNDLGLGSNESQRKSGSMRKLRKGLKMARMCLASSHAMWSSRRSPEMGIWKICWEAWWRIEALVTQNCQVHIHELQIPFSSRTSTYMMDPFVIVYIYIYTYCRYTDIMVLRPLEIKGIFQLWLMTNIWPGKPILLSLTSRIEDKVIALSCDWYVSSFKS